jgi:hypothetical protein
MTLVEVANQGYNSSLISYKWLREGMALGRLRLSQLAEKVGVVLDFGLEQWLTAAISALS